MELVTIRRRNDAAKMEEQSRAQLELVKHSRSAIDDVERSFVMRNWNW
ncbi:MULTISPECIES: hypothetical protein [unclassified Pseudonocardia]|nr:hypothetical protein [Pseudonocardia sp. Ae707_Ps1]